MGIVGEGPMNLPSLIKKMALSFLGIKELLVLRSVSRQFKVESEYAIRNQFKIYLNVDDKELYRAIVSLFSDNPETLFALLHWAIGMYFCID